MTIQLPGWDQLHENDYGYDYTVITQGDYNFDYREKHDYDYDYANTDDMYLFHVLNAKVTIIAVIICDYTN